MNEQWLANARARLRGAGYRAGGGRERVLRELARDGSPRTVHEFVDAMARDDARAGLATVYRALDALQALGLVGRLEVGAGRARYEPLGPGIEHHHHLVCDRCGTVLTFTDAALESAIEGVADRLRFHMRRHDVVLRGACPRCVTAGGILAGPATISGAAPRGE